MLSPISLLALFCLLALASAVFFIAKRINIPYTVLLVLFGIILVPVVQLPIISGTLGFLGDLKLTPELLFYIFLPILIFESAFNINIRRMVESSWTILSLSVIGLLASSFLIAGGIYFTLPLIGLEIPFLVALLFGSIISATDPVAVLALFKEYGAPKRLSLIFEGESLFNDGTAVALFLVVLTIAAEGSFNGSSALISGITTFVSMVGLGVVLGVVMAMIFSRMLRYTRSNEFVSITLLLISAHVVFIIGELINQYGIFGINLEVSSIIATTISSLFLGNYTRHILSPQSDTYIEKLLEHMAFVANSLVFILAGILFASTDIAFTQLALPIIITMLIVAAARWVSVYVALQPIIFFKKDVIPGSWQKLIAWGSIRGALAIIVVLLIPDDFSVDGWNYPYSVQELLLALTIGCILGALFIKALSIGPLMKRLNINNDSALAKAHLMNLGLYYLLTEQARFNDQRIRGYVKDKEYQQLKERIEQKIEQTVKDRESIVASDGEQPFEQALHLIAVSIEEHYLKELYIHNEIDETVYRRIKGKLTLQREKIERAQQDTIDPSLYTDRKDIFDRLIYFMQTFLTSSSDRTPLEQRVQYYRAQSIIARKCRKIIQQMQTQYQTPLFREASYHKISSIYENYRNRSAEKLEQLLEQYPEQLEGYIAEISEKALRTSGEKALHFFHEKGVASERTSREIFRRYSP